jgi:hypothetical protein
MLAVNAAAANTRTVQGPSLVVHMPVRVLRIAVLPIFIASVVAGGFLGRAAPAAPATSAAPAFDIAVTLRQPDAAPTRAAFDQASLPHGPDPAPGLPSIAPHVHAPAPDSAPTPDATPTPAAVRSDPPIASSGAPGYEIGLGTGSVAGTGGPVRLYTVEIADGLTSRQPMTDFVAFVEKVLSDPARGWTSRGTVRLQRTDDRTKAAFRVVLGSPKTVDQLCAKAGLRTVGRYSCWNGQVAAINSDRWFNAVPHVPDLQLYRTYVINHEAGHALGNGHQSCPKNGALAPVMMQLTKSTYGCKPNDVPYP